MALYGDRIIVAGNSQYNQYKNDYDFSLAVLENDIEYYPTPLTIEHTVFLPLVVR